MFSLPPFTDAKNAFDVAEASGLLLMWGITSRPFLRGLLAVGDGDECILPLDQPWSVNGKERKLSEITVRDSVARALAGKVAIRGVPIPAPYFYFMAVGAAGQASRVFVQPVARMRGTFAAIESHLEGRWWSRETDAGNVVIKIQRLDDLALLPPPMFSDRLGRPIRLPHRADFIRWMQGEIQIIEVAGSDEEAYVERLKLKESDYLAVEREHPGIRYICVTELRGRFQERSAAAVAPDSA